MGYMCIMHIYMNICMIPSPAHETPPLEWVGSPRNTPLPRILLVFCSSWHIYLCNAHAKVKLPTYNLFLHSYIHTYIYIHNPLHIPDKPSCYILCLYTTYKLSTCYIFTLYALSTKNLCILYIYIEPIYYIYITYILSIYYQEAI